jgi:hypothetical protein
MGIGAREFWGRSAGSVYHGEHMENGDQPVTKKEVELLLKQDLGLLRQELKQDIDLLRGEMNHQYRDLVERISNTQTELLKAFSGYASGNNKRIAELEGDEGAFRSRLATIEDRLLEVERCLFNLRPAA